ncbi:post-transcriptional regulator [Effusibacillus consociatus]|uniref:Post-transcriptional regulator n=1 Tax=Effusibacillus consociatus TaxID=1117041 RepID=A0ABV9Q667_9BACL
MDEKELSAMIEGLCFSKSKEFQTLGYEVEGADIWKCVSSRYTKEMPPLYQIVNDILSLKVTKYMNWAMLEAYKE